MRKACPALAIGAIVSMTRLARAEATSPLELEWAAPPVCPDVTAVRRRIETLVHGPLAARSNAVAHGTVESTGDGRFRLAVTVRTGDVADEREIDSTSCAMLAEAFAVVVALAINPSKAGVSAEEPPPSERPSPEPTARPSLPVADAGASRVAPADGMPPSAPVDARASRPERRTVPPIAFGLGTSVVWGPLPEASGGLVASVGVRLDRFRFGLLGTVAFGQRATFGRSAGASIDMIEGGAFGAYMVPLGIMSLGPSANIEATYVRVEGFGIRAPRASSTMWATPVVGGRLEVAAARWLALVARADLLFPIDASRIALGTTNDTVQLHSPAAVSPRLTLGAEFVLP